MRSARSEAMYLINMLATALLQKPEDRFGDTWLGDFLRQEVVPLDPGREVIDHVDSRVTIGCQDLPHKQHLAVRFDLQGHSQG